MVNVNLLKSYMVKAGYTQKMLAQELGISEQTLTRKLKNPQAQKTCFWHG